MGKHSIVIIIIANGLGYFVTIPSVLLQKLSELTQWMSDFFNAVIAEPYIHFLRRIFKIK